MTLPAGSSSLPWLLHICRVAALMMALVLCTTPGAWAAQEAAAPAHVSAVDGTATLERDGRSEAAPASMPILAGDRLRTQNGRVEVLFADNSALHLDVNTVVDFQSDDVIRLLEGRVRIAIARSGGDVAYRIDAPAAWVQITEAGEYRVSVLHGDRGEEVELAVLRGSAELVNDDGRTALVAGERAFARAGEAPSYAYVFNSAAWDAFDRWSEARRSDRLGVSAQYLPDQVRVYSNTFDRYGSWRHDPSYGYVWYPSVRIGWRPYYYGRWTTLRPYGWTWIGTDPWAWPTHHYGRWGFSAGVWFWIPGRHWGPAWVSWAYAPGYVSWCPLGWNNRPVMQFVNVYHGGRYHEPWHAWTVVPYRHFGGGYVHTTVSATQVDVWTRNSFVVRDTAPELRGHAVPRSTAPIRVAGTAVPRGTSPGAVAPRNSSPGVSATAPDSGAQFRSRRPGGEQLTGPGFPPSAREPRSPSAVVRSPGSGTAASGVESQAPGQTTGRGAEPRRRSPASTPSSSGSASTGTSAPDRQFDPRAIPRHYGISPADPDRGQPSSRTPAPQSPSAESSGPAEAGRDRGYRPTPREGAVYGAPGGHASDRGVRRSPDSGSWGASRPAPQAPAAGAPRAVERRPSSSGASSGASGRGPAASPSQPSAGSGKPSRGGPGSSAARPSGGGGQSSGGSAVRRPGGGSNR